MSAGRRRLLGGVAPMLLLAACAASLTGEEYGWCVGHPADLRLAAAAASVAPAEVIPSQVPLWATGANASPGTAGPIPSDPSFDAACLLASNEHRPIADRDERRAWCAGIGLQSTIAAAKELGLVRITPWPVYAWEEPGPGDWIPRDAAFVRVCRLARSASH